MLELSPSSGCLTPGEHEVTMDELEEKFAYNFGRRELIKALKTVVSELRAAGAGRIWIDGSFVTARKRPSDVDVVYEPPAGVDPKDMPGMLSWSEKARLLTLRKIDLWPHPSPQRKKIGVGFEPLEKWFQSDDYGRPKGIVILKEEADDQE